MMMAFQSQFEAVDSATPRARIGRGNISPMTTQAAVVKISHQAQVKLKSEKLTRAPGCGKEEDVDTDEGNLSRHSRRIVLAFSSSGNTHNPDDELADCHSKSSPDENSPTTVFLNDVEGNRSRADVDKSSDETNEEGILDRS